MKKLYMRTIIGSSGRECVLIVLFQPYGSKAGIFENNLLWVGQCDPPTFILEEKLIQLVVINGVFWHKWGWAFPNF